MKSTCRHSRWTVIKRTAESEHYEDERGICVPHPDSRKHYRVLEVLRCVRCNAAGSRWSRYYGATARTALKRAGVPENELPPPPNHKEKPVPAGALTRWPFPVSTHYPKEKP